MPLPRPAASRTALGLSANQSAVCSTAVQSQKALLDVAYRNKHGSLLSAAHPAKVVVNLKGCHINTGNMLGLTIREVSTTVSHECMLACSLSSMFVCGGKLHIGRFVQLASVK